MSEDNMGTVEKRVSDIVLSLIKAHREIELISTTESLTAAGLSSIDMVNFLLQIEEEFNVTIQSRAVNPTNFRSVESVAKLIEEIQDRAA